MLLDLSWDDGGHISCVAKGPNKDWCFYSATDGDDTFADPGTWRPYKQEIVMMQTVEPFAVRRLDTIAHAAPVIPINGSRG